MGSDTGLINILSYVLYIVDTLILISGAAILAVGIVVQSHFQAYGVIIAGSYINATSIAIIVIGLVVIVSSVLGLCGAFRKSRYLLGVFVVLMTFVFIAEGAAGGVALAHVDATEDFFESQFRIFFDQEYSFDTTSEIFDVMQRQLQCCGVNSTLDYYIHYENETVPQSCCSETAASCTQASGWPSGCFAEFMDYVAEHLYLVGSVTVSFAVLELLAIFFSIWLSHQYRKKRDRERAANKSRF